MRSYSHFFSKNNCGLDIVLTRTVNILTTNKLVKLTMLRTTGPRTVLENLGNHLVVATCYTDDKLIQMEDKITNKPSTQLQIRVGVQTILFLFST